VKKKPPAGRTPKATNISQFYDSANGSRHPGDWPSLLRRSWEERFGQTQPYPYGPDNIQSPGSRASQYTS
jgi:hypothetical protein